MAGLLIEPLFISTNNEKIRSVYYNRSVCYSWFPEKRLFYWLCAVRWIDSADIKGVQFANPFHEPHSIQIKILHIHTTNSETYISVPVADPSLVLKNPRAPNLNHFFQSTYAMQTPTIGGLWMKNTFHVIKHQGNFFLKLCIKISLKFSFKQPLRIEFCWK